jgi:hypothetical protein
VLVGAVVVLIGSVAAFPGAVSARQSSAWPARGVAALRLAAERNPRARVLADDRHSDFALWAAPALSGRLINDVRFELLNRGELDRLVRFERDRGPQDPGGAGIVVLDPKRQQAAPWLAHGWRAVYDGASMVVLER